MTIAEYETKLDYFTDQLGIRQVKIDEGIQWAFAANDVQQIRMKKAFIYLNTLSSYTPMGESSNSLTEQQINFIFTQLEKLL